MRGRMLNRADNVVITGATAEIAFYGFPDFGFRRIRIALKQVGSHHDHARCAEPALKAVLLVEGFLKGMEGIPGCQAFNGGDRSSVGLASQQGAGFNGAMPFQVYRAGPATRGIAADMRTRQPQRVPQVMDQQLPRVYLVGIGFSININRNLHRIGL